MRAMLMLQDANSVGNYSEIVFHGLFYSTYCNVYGEKSIKCKFVLKIVEIFGDF